MLPALFIPHGAPDLILTDEPSRGFLARLSETFPNPKAIVVISAHWEAPQLALTSAKAPKTWHDFSGWPAPLYDLAYPARTDFSAIDRITELLREQGLAIKHDDNRPYDHGAWIPLMLAYPQADIPVIQLSLVEGASERQHFEIGLLLAPLRAEGILIIGSGSTTHNLRRLAPEGSPPPDWALTFDEWLQEAISRRDVRALTSYRTVVDTAAVAHPTPEHLAPLFVALGAGWAGGQARTIHKSYTYGSIGMTSFAFGTAEEIGYFPEADTIRKTYTAHSNYYDSPAAALRRQAGEAIHPN